MRPTLWRAATVSAAALMITAGVALAASHYDTGATNKEIKIGNIMPYSGPASAYGVIGRVEAAYFRKINDEGGINGRKIDFISYDDGYSPPKTVEEARKLVEDDGVLLIFNSLGTPTNTAIRHYMNEQKVPQLFVATGATKWNDPKAYPWTMGWQPSYQTEAGIYAKYILKNKPNAKIGVLYQNDAYGQNYLNGLKTGLGAHKSAIVDAESYNLTDSAQVIAAHELAMEKAGADTFVIFATPQAAIYALIDRGAIGWSPLTIVNNVSANRLFLLSAGQNGASLNGVISTGYTASPTVQANLKGMQFGKQIIAKYAPALNSSWAEGDGNLVYGLAVAWTFVDALKHAGKNPTRASLMKALRNLNESGKNKNPFVYPGMNVKTSKSRTFPMEQLKLEKWEGGKGGDWHSFGKLYTGIH